MIIRLVIPAMLAVFISLLPAKGSVVEEAREFLLGPGNTAREWTYEAFRYELSEPDRCKAGGKLKFSPEGKLTWSRCVEGRLQVRDLPWKLSAVSDIHCELIVGKEGSKDLSRYLLALHPTEKGSRVLEFTIVRRGSSDRGVLLKEKLSLTHTIPRP